MDSLDTLLAREDLGDLSDSSALDWIGRTIDLSSDLLSENGLRRALQWCDALEAKLPEGELRALICYFRANAWAGLEQLRHNTQGEAARWSWEQPEAEKQIFFLRSSLNQAGFHQLDIVRKCQIFTNLANLLNSAGRPVEALEYWGMNRPGFAGGSNS